MLFKKNSLTLLIAAAMSATTAYAATLSEATPPVVGFKPVFENTTGSGAISGELKAGATLTVDPEKLTFKDLDGDLPAYNKTIYSWWVGDEDIPSGEEASFTLGKNTVGKKIILKVTPVSETGDPLEGKMLTLANLSEAGVGGGDENGNVKPDGNAKPYVSNLNIAGKLAVGEQLTASYQFNANGGDLTDTSISAWGTKGTSVGQISSGNAVNTDNGSVPDYTITLADAGEVLEVSVKAKNGAGVDGNILTVGTDNDVHNDDNGSGGNPDEGGNSGGNGGLETDGGDGQNPGEIPYVPADPQEGSVSIEFTSTATADDNGVDGERPVASKDKMTVTFKPAEGASPNAEDYKFTWMAQGQEIEGVNGQEFTPDAKHQGMEISVSVEPKQ